jgi:hypothetical protein
MLTIRAEVAVGQRIGDRSMHEWRNSVAIG